MVGEEEYDEDIHYAEMMSRFYVYAVHGAHRRSLQTGPLQDIVESFIGDIENTLRRIDMLRFLKCTMFGRENKDWYRDTPIVFREMLPEFGIKDIDLFIQLFAITSAHTNFQANISTASKVYHMFQKGQKKFTGEGFLPAIVGMLDDFRGGKMDFSIEPPRDGRRKIINFGRALLGDTNAVVCDIWLMEAFWIAEYYKWQGRINSYTPRVYEYDAIEAMVREMAKQTKLEPRQIVSMAWAGARILMGKHKTHNTRTIVLNVFKQRK